jgi:hypothetical protein
MEEYRMATNVAVCLSFDFDAICVWLGSLNATSPSAISRGEFGAVATERLLNMLARWDIKSTWFIPGHTIDTYPDLVRRVADAGHEIGHHTTATKIQSRSRSTRKSGCSTAEPKRFGG